MSKLILINQIFADGVNLSAFVLNQEEKNNYYFAPDEKLHKQHEVILEYRNNDLGLIIQVDELVRVIGNLLYTLEELLENKHILPADVSLGEMGRYINLELHKSVLDVNYKSSEKIMPYWFASNISTQAWAYNKDGHMYLEVSPTFPWHFEEPLEGEKFTPIDEFISNYKCYALIKIDEKSAYEIIENARKILLDSEEEYFRMRSEIIKKEKVKSTNFFS